MKRVQPPSAAFVQVRLHLPTLARLEALPQSSVSKADDHSVDERKANATECQLSIYAPVSALTYRDVPAEQTVRRVTLVDFASPARLNLIGGGCGGLRSVTNARGAAR